MYRRDISSTLRILAVLLGAFVVYHLWTQPSTTSGPVPASPPASGIDATPNFPPALVEPAPPHDLPRTRLIEPGDAPSTAHQQIRDDLDRGEYKAAEAALRALGDKRFATVRDKAYVAALWNNLGVQQEKTSGIEVSVNAFKRAAALAPRNPTALLNLTQAYWGLRHQALTAEYLERVIQVTPYNPFPHLALAELLIDKGRKTEAGSHLKRARATINHDLNLTTLLEKLELKAQQASVTTPQKTARTQKSKPAELTPEQSSPQAPLSIPSPAEVREAVPAVPVPTVVAP